MRILFISGICYLLFALVPKIMEQLAKLRTAGMMLVSALLFAFALSYLANAAGSEADAGAMGEKELKWPGMRRAESPENLPNG